MLAIIQTRPLLPQLNENDSDDEESTPRESMSYAAMSQMNDLRIQNKLCDFDIELDDGKVFKVHQAILGACSDYFRFVDERFLKTLLQVASYDKYFRTLFTTTIHDEAPSRTLLKEVRSEIMEVIIQYAYLRNIKPINGDNVREVMFWSDFLGVLGLMKHCIDFIIKTLSPENCVINWLMSK